MDEQPINDETKTVDDENVKTDEIIQDTEVKSLKKNIVIFIVITLLLAVGIAMIFLLKNKEDTVNNTTSEQPENSEQTPKDTPELATITTIPGVEGINFKVPDGWTVQETENVDVPNYYSYNLLSPGVNNMQDGYTSISGGLSIGIRNSGRDVENEKEYDEPWKAYVSSVGAPVIEDVSVEYYEQKTDYSKIMELTNPNGMVMHYYSWAYEGCFLDVFSLSESKVFNFTITSGEDNCPELGIIEDNTDVATFIDSLAFGESQLVTASAYVKDLSDNDKEGLSDAISTTVLTKNVRFSYKKSIITSEGGSSSNFYLFSFVGVPVLNEDQTLKILNVGESAEDLRLAYGDNCPECGFSMDIYGENIQYKEGQADMSGYVMLSSSVYGKISDVAPASKGNEAKQYEYIKQIGDNTYFEVRFIAESSEDDYSGKLPSVDSLDILKFIDNIVIIE